MTSEDKELLSEKVVAVCHASGRLGLPEDRILRALAGANFKLNEDELEIELQYLSDGGGKGYIRQVVKELRPDRRRWTSTALGAEFLMNRGLA